MKVGNCKGQLFRAVTTQQVVAAPCMHILTSMPGSFVGAVVEPGPSR